MGGEWKKVPITDIYTISSGLSKPASDFGSGYPFVAFKDVFYNYFLPKHLEQLVQSSERDREKCSVLRGDVFLTRTSETMNELGMSSVALKDYENATFNGFTKRLRPKEKDLVLPEYVGYYLRSAVFRQAMLSFSTMSTRASLNNEMIGRLNLLVPPAHVQVSIAHILRAIDDKIELNRQTNETLEAMAQALFKSWFVDFDPVIDNALAAGNDIPELFKTRAAARQALGDARKPLPEGIRREFPDGFEFRDEMGWVPRGWGYTTLGEHVQFKTGPAFKSQEFSDSGVRLARGDNVKEGYFHWGSKSRFWRGVENGLEQYLLQEGDVLIGMDGSKVGKNRVRVCKSDLPCLLVQRVARIRSMDTICNNYISLLISTERFREYVELVKTGSAIPHISGSQIKNLPMVLPQDRESPIFSFFQQLSSPYCSKIDFGNSESDVLGRLRDALLPQLLTGQLTIPDAEKFVATAV